MNKDLYHLNLLSKFHYAVAVIIAVFSLFPIIHLFIGISILTGGFFAEGANQNEPFPSFLFGIMFTIIPLIFILGGLTLAVCTFIAGRKLLKREGYTFCLIVAGCLCMMMPFGTVLGVFTIILLMKDSVKLQFTESVRASSESVAPNLP